MFPDRVSNPGPLTKESDALPIALRGPANFEYSYYVSSILANRATAFLLLYSSTNICRYEYGYRCTNYGELVLVLDGTTSEPSAYSKTCKPAILKRVQDKRLKQTIRKYFFSLPEMLAA